MSTDILKFALKLIALMGYPGLFLGLFIEFIGIAFPGEIVLTFTGFLIWNGHLNLIPSVAAAVGGSLCGTGLAYYLGRHYGRPFLERYGKYVLIRKKTIVKAERWFNRHSFLVLLLGRFMPGIRPLSAYMAGIAHMKFWIFAPFSLLGVLLWCLTFITLGTKLGQNWGRVSGLLEKYNMVLIILLLLMVAGLASLKIWQKFKPGD